jgi:fimbrial chaperone protein
MGGKRRRREDGRFVITPPLFAMQGKKRIPCALSMRPTTSCRRIGKAVLDERESHPSMDKSKLSDNTLQLAIISRIKLYYRPANWRCRRIRRRKS